MRHERRCLRVVRRPEPEQRRRAAEALGEVRERRNADPAAYEERSGDAEVEAVAERACDVDRITRLERGDRGRPGADGLEEEPELVGQRQTEAERARKHATGRLEHEELPRRSRLEVAAREPDERVRADPLLADDAEQLAAHRVSRLRRRR